MLPLKQVRMARTAPRFSVVLLHTMLLASMGVPAQSSLSLSLSLRVIELSG